MSAPSLPDPSAAKGCSLKLVQSAKDWRWLSLCTNKPSLGAVSVGLHLRVLNTDHTTDEGAA